MLGTALLGAIADATRATLHGANAQAFLAEVRRCCAVLCCSVFSLAAACLSVRGMHICIVFLVAQRGMACSQPACQLCRRAVS